MHFGISEGKGGGGVKIWKPSVVVYGYFLELPITLRTFITFITFEASTACMFVL